MSTSILNIDPYELCPCGSQKKHKFCCRDKLNLAYLLEKEGRGEKADEVFGIKELTLFANNDPNPLRRAEWADILQETVQYGVNKEETNGST